MIYDLKLVLTHEFERPTGGGRQHVRVTPADLPGQSLLSHEVTVTPAPKERRSFTDFWGTEVTELVMPPGLTEVRIELRARVARDEPLAALDMSPPLERLAGDLAQVDDLGPLAPHHYRKPSPRIAADAAIAAFAAKVMKAAIPVPGSTPATPPPVTTRASVAALGRALHALMTFDAKATEVDTLPAHAFALKRGVCQDFAQIMIAGLRSQGVPAGYVAGYLRTLPPPGKKRLEGADAMHAWVTAWCGIEAGWQQYDPTNACWAGVDHVVVGQGRDYGDVAPLIGSMRAEGGQHGAHAVDLVEVPAAAAPSAAAPSAALSPPVALP